ncbi:50S ribosomal protein L30e [Candidatus Marsarchaeota archaeon]|nr:50S ribosomal protein L30e [Candidatus Marsarchaeota archaeon]MCL5404931.1 50S ribosomal protein L30e [Candidatus Marsarchaeota archaeon]
MADLSSEIRLAIDSGVTALGTNSTLKSIRDNKAKLIIVASTSKGDAIQDVAHISKVAGIPLIAFKGNPTELGAVCGKPFSISMLSVIDQGNSHILEMQKIEE